MASFDDIDESFFDELLEVYDGARERVLYRGFWIRRAAVFEGFTAICGAVRRYDRNLFALCRAVDELTGVSAHVAVSHLPPVEETADFWPDLARLDA